MSVNAHNSDKNYKTDRDAKQNIPAIITKVLKVIETKSDKQKNKYF